MPNYALLLEYNGRGFHGWQKQPDVRTIQEELQKSLELVIRAPIKKLTASGRTDSGVHAKKQVVNFFTEKAIDFKKVPVAVSSILKNEVGILGLKEVDLKFDACRFANAKTYEYLILNRLVPPVLNADFCWHVTTPLDLDKLNSDAQILVGKYDFTSFRASGCGARSPIKEIYSININKNNDLISFKIRGSGFLKQMVRNIIGTLVDLQQGKIHISILNLLEVKDRKLAGRTAPAHALSLLEVEYKDKIF